MPRTIRHTFATLLVTALVAAVAIVSAPPANAQAATCVTNVSTEAELVDCIAFLNAGNDTTVVLQNDIVPAAPLPVINTFGLLELDGGGHTIDTGTNASADYVFDVTDGDLQLENVTITGGSAAGIRILQGAMVMERVTIRGNGLGLSLAGDGIAWIDVSTIADNSTGIFLTDDMIVRITSSTVAFNDSSGIVGNGNALVSSLDTIISNNGGVECAGGFDFEYDFGNFIDDATCNGEATPGMQASLDPAGLGANGCAAPCTHTVALLPKSPAINAGFVCEFPNLTDQRGVARPNPGCDGGSYEFEFPEEFCANQLVTHSHNYLPAPVYATDGDDVILGSPDDDVIWAFGGDDRICGGEGDDLIRAGAGDDVIFAGGGDDRVLAGGGDDIVDGAGGEDTINGQGGFDTIAGGPDNDTINGQGSSDQIDGGQGDDKISGNASADWIVGGLGDDILDGQNGSDTIEGGPGADIIRGQTGPDVLRGHDDDDSLSGGGGNDELVGGAGTDRCAGNTGPADRAEAASCESTPGVEILF